MAFSKPSCTCLLMLLVLPSILLIAAFLLYPEYFPVYSHLFSPPSSTKLPLTTSNSNTTISAVNFVATSAPIVTNVFKFQKLDDQLMKKNQERVQNFSNSEWEAEVWRLADKNLALNKYLIISIMNYGNLEFALNWVTSLERNGFHKFLLFCYDTQTFNALASNSLLDNIVMVPREWLNKGVPSMELLWGTQTYNMLTHTKIDIVLKLLEADYTVLFSDVDIVFLSPRVVDYIDSISSAHDMLYMVDGPSDVNTGFYIAKPTISIKLLFREVQKQNKDTNNDQIFFNIVVGRLNQETRSKMQPLDALLFTNGERYYKQLMNDKANVTPLVVHANHFVGAKSKIEKFKSSKMWYLE